MFNTSAVNGVVLKFGELRTITLKFIGTICQVMNPFQSYVTSVDSKPCSFQILL